MSSGKPRLCPRCGNLVGSEDDRCFSCGLTMGGAGHGAAAVKRILMRYGSTTSILAGMMVVFFLGMYVVQGSPFPQNVRETGLLRTLMFGFDPQVFIRCGIQNPWCIREHGEIWRFVTAMFIHGGIIHIGFNIYVLLQLGRICEFYFDARRAFSIFFVAGAAGFVGSFVSGTPSLGASGAIMGLAGAILAKARWSGGGIDRMIYTQLLRWVIMIVIIGFVASGLIDWVGHLVGVLVGGGLGYLLIREGGGRGHVHAALFWSCVVLCAAGLIAGLVYCLTWPPSAYPV